MDKPLLSSFEGSVRSPMQFLPTKRGRDGIDGADGKDGKNGEKGEKGEKGERGDVGNMGARGPAGADGRNGADGRDGRNGRDGEQGSADTAEDIIKKLTGSKKRIPRALIEGLEEKLEEVLANLRRRGRGGDNILMGGSGLLAVLSNGAGGSRVAQINFGSGLTVTPTGDGTSVDVTSTGSSGSSYQVPTSGVVDGSNAVFVWATAPNVIVTDGAPKQKTQSDGTPNWTGTTTTTLAVPPNFDIYASA